SGEGAAGAGARLAARRRRERAAPLPRELPRRAPARRNRLAPQPPHAPRRPALRAARVHRTGAARARTPRRAARRARAPPRLPAPRAGRAMSTPCDAVVVGAGPAGSATALLLARAGHDVLLLDRRDFPRAKPCGDCLSPEAARVLDRLGLLADVLAARPARLGGWRIISPAGHAFEAAFAPAPTGAARVRTALPLRRGLHDAVLLAGARRAGADVRTGRHVTDLLRDARGCVSGVEARDHEGRAL